ncbi:L-aspartate oxidase [Pseudoclavibacter sp. JAI123]|uniref:L-aspartate oxidase n=1 Tax=Pseudoclavibacter sp. JAI123 TaxID=2723065 RepID=UPI0015CA73C8|nr:FAD-dependent oxidoreductase [Pseudoclavibacter sp. JAI123]NYF12402.1 L-aspartate oxidase [Pseudoclavibacter sp. JAI123]
MGAGADARGADARLRVLVVGSGIAGLTAALAAAADGHDVMVATKATLGNTATSHAQGGIAAVLAAGADASAGDSVESHVRDTLAAGAGLGDRRAIEVLCGSADARIRDLVALGTRFDRVPHAEAAAAADTAEPSPSRSSPSRPEGPLPVADGDHLRQLARGLEAAHSHPRILHAFGDGTGREIQRALSDAARAAAERGELRLLEHTFLVDLAVSTAADDVDPAATRVVGAWLLGPDDRTPGFFEADAVVLATGGAGQLFAHTSNPAVATGDGIAAAARAGAEIADLEFVQFHPTVLAGSGGALISEAVRGEGALLLNDAGERFLVGVHPDAELAPRDVVARGIADEMAKQGGRPVRLDARHLGRGFLEHRFPSITARLDEAGLDWSRETVPVTPAAHYLMGGVVTDLLGRTSIPGLYAAGETARTGVHGANRLASNSLLEGTVFGHRVAEALREQAPHGQTLLGQAQPEQAQLDRVSDVAVSPTPDQLQCKNTSIRALRAISGQNRTDVGHRTASGRAPAFSRPALQTLMWASAGLHRSGPALDDAARALAVWADDRDAAGPDLSVAAREDTNLLTLAQLTVAAARARGESAGAHFRADRPSAREPHAQAPPLSPSLFPHPHPHPRPLPLKPKAMAH